MLWCYAKSGCQVIRQKFPKVNLGIEICFGRWIDEFRSGRNKCHLIRSYWCCYSMCGSYCQNFWARMLDGSNRIYWMTIFLFYNVFRLSYQHSDQDFYCIILTTKGVTCWHCFPLFPHFPNGTQKPFSILLTFYDDDESTTTTKNPGLNVGHVEQKIMLEWATTNFFLSNY